MFIFACCECQHISTTLLASKRKLFMCRKIVNKDKKLDRISTSPNAFKMNKAQYFQIQVTIEMLYALHTTQNAKFQCLFTYYQNKSKSLTKYLSFTIRFCTVEKSLVQAVIHSPLLIWHVYMHYPTHLTHQYSLPKPICHICLPHRQSQM